MNEEDRSIAMTNDLSGFKEVADLKEPPSLGNRVRDDDHVLTHHLQHELERLNKIYDFFGKKLENQIKYSKTSELIEEQIKENNFLKQDLCKRLKNPESPIQKRLSIWWQNVF